MNSNIITLIAFTFAASSFCAWPKMRLGCCHPTLVDAASPQELVLRPIQTHPWAAHFLQV